MRRLLTPTRTDALALVLLTLSALGVLVAGVQHARLFHRGYAEVEVVGLLFLMNAIGSAAVVLALVAQRIWAFVLGTLSVCVPSLVSIAISHSSMGFLGFREGGYDVDALVIVAAELAAVVFAVMGAVAAARGTTVGGAAVAPARGLVAALVVAVVGCAIAGIGMGEAPAERERAPDAAQVRAARERITAGGASARRGERLFAEQGCDRCHSIAAITAEGRLGPRLDTIDEDAGDNLESIEDPRDDVADGYPERLMPADFGERLDAEELLALALFVTAASGGEDGGVEDDDGDGGGGRGHGRSGRG
jgi:hypothetical protein